MVTIIWSVLFLELTYCRCPCTLSEIEFLGAFCSILPYVRTVSLCPCAVVTAQGFLLYNLAIYRGAASDTDCIGKMANAYKVGLFHMETDTVRKLAPGTCRLRPLSC